jgi:hypothetical protein
MEKKTINYYMRSLHRDIGFLIIGLTIIYGLSGIVLIYRDSGFLKHEKQIQKQLPQNVQNSELGMALHIKDFQVLRTEGDMVYFQTGTYNKATGMANYSDKVLPAFLQKFNNLHMASSKKFVHWISLILGISLIFLAISSFWMFKPSTKLFRRGIIFAGIGVCVAVIMLFL